MSKFRFEHPATEEVYQALTEIEQAEQHLARALSHLPHLIGDNEELRQAIISHFYWYEEKIKPSSLADIFGLGEKSVGRYAGHASLTRICQTCQQEFELVVTSRANLKDLTDGYRAQKQCGSCSEKEKLAKAQRSSQVLQEYQAQRAAAFARIEYLRTMPYREYLQTPEWGEIRKGALKRASFRCQVCNAYGVRLNVHHRTYERRGNEDNRDLIVLCEDCHGIFHENGSLA